MVAFWWLNARDLWVHRWRAALSVVGVAAGVGLVVAVLSVVTSVRDSASAATRLAGDRGILISAPSTAGMAPSILDDVAATPGVAHAAPLVVTHAAIATIETVLVGVDPARPPQLDAGLVRNVAALAVTLQVGPSDLLVSQDLATAAGIVAPASISVIGPAGAASTGRVAAALDGPGLGLPPGHLALTSLAEATRLAGRGDRLDVVIADPAAGDRARLLDALHARFDGRAIVTTASERRAQALEAISPVIQPLLLMSGLALVVGAFLVFNTMNMAALERRHSMALLRCVGGGRGQLAILLLAETAVLGAVGAALGVVFGLAAAGQVIAQIPPVFADLLGAPIVLNVEPAMVGAAAAAGLAVALTAGAIPTWRILRIEPIEALAPEHRTLENTSEKPSTAVAFGVVGVACCAAGLAGRRVGLAAPAAFGAGALVLTRAFAGAIAATEVFLAGKLGTPGRLAAASSARSPRRAWTSTAAIVAAITVVVGATGIVDNVKAAGRSRSETVRRTDLFVSTASGGARTPTIGLPDAMRNSLAAIPGVRRVAADRYDATVINGRLVTLVGADPASNLPQLALAPPEARAAFTRGEGAVVTRQVATTFGVGIGDQVKLPTPAGPVPLRLLGITDSFSVSPNGTIVIPYDTANRLLGSAGASYEIQLQPGADLRTVRTAVDAATKTIAVPVYALTGDDLIADVLASMEQLNSLIGAILLVMVATAGVSVLNTLAASVLARTRELALLHALGATPRELRLAVISEAAATAVIGGAIGLATGATVHRLAVTALQTASPYPVDYHPSWTAIGSAPLAAAAIALVGALIPARLAARGAITTRLAAD